MILTINTNDYTLGHLTEAMSQDNRTSFLQSLLALETINPAVKLFLAVVAVKGTGGLVLGTMYGISAFSLHSILISSGLTIWALIDLNRQAKQFLKDK